MYHVRQRNGVRMSLSVDTSKIQQAGQALQPAELKHDNKAKSDDEQQKELVSKEGSAAARSSALAGIKLHQHPTITQGGKDYRVEGKYRIVNSMTSDEANMFWATRGYKDEPYKDGTQADIIQLRENTRFVRTYDGKNSGQLGSWMMKYDDIKGLTPEQIADKFALPQVPKYICDVVVPAGTNLRTGECNPLYGWKGGGQQFDLMGVRIDKECYVDEREIGKAVA